MGITDDAIHHIDVLSMREGPQLSMEQRENLMAVVSKLEILKALNGIGDLKALGIDGFGAKISRLVGW